MLRFVQVATGRLVTSCHKVYFKHSVLCWQITYIPSETQQSIRFLLPGWRFRIFKNFTTYAAYALPNPPGNRGNIALAFQIWHRIVLTAMRVRNPELIELFKSSSVWPDWQRIEIVSLQTSFLGAQMWRNKVSLNEGAPLSSQRNYDHQYRTFWRVPKGPKVLP